MRRAQVEAVSIVPIDKRLESYDVISLRCFCLQRKLSTKGTKKELIVRLQEYGRTHGGVKLPESMEAFMTRVSECGVLESHNDRVKFCKELGIIPRGRIKKERLEEALAGHLQKKGMTLAQLAMEYLASGGAEADENGEVDENAKGDENGNGGGNVDERDEEAGEHHEPEGDEEDGKGDENAAKGDEGVETAKAGEEGVETAKAGEEGVGTAKAGEDGAEPATKKQKKATGAGAAEDGEHNEDGGDEEDGKGRENAAKGGDEGVETAKAGEDAAEPATKKQKKATGAGAAEDGEHNEDGGDEEDGKGDENAAKGDEGVETAKAGEEGVGTAKGVETAKAGEDAAEPATKKQKKATGAGAAEDGEHNEDGGDEEDGKGDENAKGDEDKGDEERVHEDEDDEEDGKGDENAKGDENDEHEKGNGDENNDEKGKKAGTAKAGKRDRDEGDEEEPATRKQKKATEGDGGDGEGLYCVVGLGCCVYKQFLKDGGPAPSLSGVKLCPGCMKPIHPDCGILDDASANPEDPVHWCPECMPTPNNVDRQGMATLRRYAGPRGIKGRSRVAIADSLKGFWKGQDSEEQTAGQSAAKRGGDSEAQAGKAQAGRGRERKKLFPSDSEYESESDGDTETVEDPPMLDFKGDFSWVPTKIRAMVCCPIEGCGEMIVGRGSKKSPLGTEKVRLYARLRHKRLLKDGGSGLKNLSELVGEEPPTAGSGLPTLADLKASKNRRKGVDGGIKATFLPGKNGRWLDLMIMMGKQRSNNFPGNIRKHFMEKHLGEEFPEGCCRKNLTPKQHVHQWNAAQTVLENKIDMKIFTPYYKSVCHKSQIRRLKNYALTADEEAAAWKNALASYVKRIKQVEGVASLDEEEMAQSAGRQEEV